MREPWGRHEKLKREKATLGFYVSGHPLDAYREELKRFCNVNSASIAGVAEGSAVSMGGVVEDYRERPTKTGGKMAFFQLDDPYGRVEVIVRQRAVEQFREVLGERLPVVITGIARAEREGQGGGGGGRGRAKTTAAGRTRARTRSCCSSRRRRSCKRSAPRRAGARARARRSRRQEEARRAAANARVASGKLPGDRAARVDRDWHVTFGSQSKLTVEPSEAMMSALERLFGEKVCELR